MNTISMSFCLASTSRFPNRHLAWFGSMRLPAWIPCGFLAVVFGFAVVMAQVRRPVPFRTRKLRPGTAMVLHSRGCGRVARRRIRLVGGSRGAYGSGNPHFFCFVSLFLSVRGRSGRVPSRGFPGGPSCFPFPSFFGPSERDPTRGLPDSPFLRYYHYTAGARKSSQVLLRVCGDINHHHERDSVGESVQVSYHIQTLIEIVTDATVELRCSV